MVAFGHPFGIQPPNIILERFVQGYVQRLQHRCQTAWNDGEISPQLFQLRPNGVDKVTAEAVDDQQRRVKKCPWAASPDSLYPIYHKVNGHPTFFLYPYMNSRGELGFREGLPFKNNERWQLTTIRCYGEHDGAPLLLGICCSDVHCSDKHTPNTFLLNSCARRHVKVERRLIRVSDLLEQQVLFLPDR